MALEATGGSLERAAELLTRRRAARQAAAGGPVTYQINELLREQKPWNEFFERFLWPEHWAERVQTNLLYYRANYAIICTGVSGIYVLLHPALLIISGLVAGLVYGAVSWGDARPVPGLGQPLQLQQRLVAAALASAFMVNQSGSLQHLARVMLVCAGLILGHATFRARSLAARWSFFKEQVEKAD